MFAEKVQTKVAATANKSFGDHAKWAADIRWLDCGYKTQTH